MKTTGLEPYDLIIVGAGPVGLLAAILARKSGLKVLVLEKNSGPTKHSRSIGIHPPSLELFADIGLLDTFLARGKMIRRGVACSQHGDRLGTLDFHSADTPFDYILTVPQWITESILIEELNALGPGTLNWDTTVTGLTEGELCDVQFSKKITIRDVRVSPSEGSYVDHGLYRKKTSHSAGPAPAQTTGTCYSRDRKTGTISQVLQAKMVMGCDGKKSVIRQLTGISYSGRAYASRYAMGDFADNTSYESDAVIFLSRKGLVESFPLPDGFRRWVVQQDKANPIYSTGSFTEQIGQRCGMAPDSADCIMFSEFGVERYLAETFWRGRVILAGDSAHVVSPIGGQGMNLGWINAAHAIRLIASVLKNRTSPGDAAQLYNRQARDRAKKVIRRAEFNMMLANRNPLHRLRNRLVSLLLASPVRHSLRRRFTMQNL